MVIISMLRSCAANAGYTTNGSGIGVVTSNYTEAPVVEDLSSETEPDTGSTIVADTTVSGDAREKRYKPVGNGNDTVTIMIYMCGTDLESKYGMATSDLAEMCAATISDKVNVIVETGGCSKWRNNVVSASYNEIYRVKDGGVERLAQNKATSMVKGSNLTDFINYCTKNFPADRNILIMWDHGGGSITGYGYDELKGGNDSMTLDEFSTAIANSGCIFDWIGFDACLMATYETAIVANNYADYLIASEESEPGTGWYYTNWLTKLSANTSMDTVKLGKIICDDFVNTSVKADSSAEVTLSVIDLAELQGTAFTPFSNFSSSVSTLLSASQYSTVSTARSGVRQFAASSRLNQVDLIDLADRMNTTEAKALAKALRSCVKYNNSTISKAYGVSIYFPYESTYSLNSAVSTFDAIGLDSRYITCIKSFASLMTGGQIASSSSYGYNYDSSSLDLTSLLGTLTGMSSSSYDSSYSDYSTSSLLGSLLGSYTNSSGYTSSGSSISAEDIMSLLSSFSGRSVGSEQSWVDPELIAAAADYVSENYINPGDIFVQNKNGHRVVTFTDSQWELLQTIELNVFVDDGEGYIDLGLDNVFTVDGNDLVLDYDNTWLTVNGHVVAYYLVSDTEEKDGSYTTVGRIPAILTREINGKASSEYVDLKVIFDKAHPYGVIEGATVAYVNEGSGTQSKGTLPLREGDKLQFLCDYYGYDGTYSATYELGEPITLDNTGITLANMDLGDVTCSVTFRLTDIYNNYFWTPAYTTD